MSTSAVIAQIVEPQAGPQAMMVRCPAEEVLYGGARGGGKSYGALLDFNEHQCRYGRYARGIIFRQSYSELEDLMSKADELYPQLGAKWMAQKKMWVFPDGGWLKMRYLEKAKDTQRYQGHEYTWVGVDEAGNYPTPDVIDAMRATLRSPHGVKKRMFLSANPGGVGHNWLKERYIDPAPPMHMIHEVSKVTGQVWRRIFIPAKVQDNKLLMLNDPGYIDNIIKATTGKPWLLKAWLEGSWDIVAGGIMDDLWRAETHVIRPFPIPIQWRIDRSFDYGSSKPFSVGWWTESDGSTIALPDGTQRTYPRGTVFRIAEWYGWNGKANQGIRMLAKDIARGVKEREAAMRIAGRVSPGPADNSIYDVINGTCIADDMAQVGIGWTRSDKGPGSRIAGWEKIREMLANSIDNPRDEPGLYIFETCRHWIRTVPVLPRDDKNPDDVDTNAEDHSGDETRYRLRAKKRIAGRMGTKGT